MELMIYILLAATSIVGLAFIVERGIALQWRKVVPAEIEAAVEAFQSPEDLPKVRSACQTKPSALGRLLLHSMEHLDWPKAENADALQTRARHELVRLERGLVVLEVIVGIAPLLGLVGTIIGMMAMFAHVGTEGLSDANRLASSIALILRATLIGLLIAIPALIAWSYYSKKIEMFAAEMETLCDQFLRRHYREKVEK